ncbi:MAG: hypothetical protein GDYSWBUE_000469 [Candidatus Fervidibacterota bacterium]
MRGAIVAMVVGIICVVAGVVLIIVCWEQFKTMFWGALGPVVLLGGLLLAAIGWSEYEAAKQWREATSAVTQPKPEAKPAEAQPPSEAPKETQPEQPAQQPSEGQEASEQA